jgi:isopenicillin-N N-acyltransferase-like protein
MSNVIESSKKASVRYPFLTVTGSTYEMGRQLGEERRESVRAMRAEVLSNLVEARVPFGTGLTEAQLREEIQNYMRLLEEAAPAVADELRGMSEGADIELADAYLMQVPFAGCGLLMGSRGWREPTRSLEEYFAGTTGGCTTFSVTPEAAANDKVFIGQTCDFYPNYKEHWIVLEKVPDEGPAMLNAVPSGILTWGNGLNSAGLGLEYNLLGYPDAKYGLSPLVVGRMILNQTSFQDAVDTALRADRGTGWNWMIADDQGNARDLEVTATDHEQLEPQDGILTHANCYMSDRFASEDLSVQLLPDSHLRTNRMRQLLAQRKGEIDVDYIKSCYEDHLGYPASICRHPVPEVPMNENIDSNILVISDLKERKLYACPGPICEHELVEYTFSSN